MRDHDVLSGIPGQPRHLQPLRQAAANLCCASGDAFPFSCSAPSALTLPTSSHGTKSAQLVWPVLEKAFEANAAITDSLGRSLASATEAMFSFTVSCLGGCYILTGKEDAVACTMHCVPSSSGSCQLNRCL